MLSKEEFVALCKQLGLSEKAQQAVNQIRSSPPSRRVRSAFGNVTVRYPSKKMGVTIQAESHRNELAGIYEKEHDNETLEYYDQPPAIKLVYQAKSGRMVGVWHTSDYFVIRKEGMGWEEWKMEEELLELAEKMPNRYIRGKDNRWYCPPGESYAKEYGLFYHVRSSAEINWIFQRNMLFLEDYLRSDCPGVGEKIAQAIQSLVAGSPGISLKELIERAEVSSTDIIYTLIAREDVYADIYRMTLAEPERVVVFRDKESAKAYDLIVKNTVLSEGLGKPLMNLDEQTISSKIQELFSQASQEDLSEANRRYAIITPCLAGNTVADETIPARTIRDWRRKWKQASQIYGCGYVGLLPRRKESGNRNCKLPENVLTLLNEFITNEYETIKQKPKYEVYAMLERECQERGIPVPCYKTFVCAVNQRPRHEQIKKRAGKRAAYASEPFYRELQLTTPRHGDRPFEIGHIDHTQLDVELVCSQTGRNLGRPWATFLTDAYSRRLLAVYLTYDPPSYRSCMMILRECVRKLSRLPQIIVVDGGHEFESTYFETLLARYECTKKTRPSSKARFGSVCERLFGTTNTRFIHNLLGNTQIMRNVRQVTKSVNPKTHACWTLDRLYGRLCQWAYEIYDMIDHPALHQSPRETFEEGLKQSGSRQHRMICYDENFRMLTLPSTKKGIAMVVPTLGVKINYIYYWSEKFLDPEIENTQVPVRFDPFDMGIAYAFVKGHWVSCISEHHSRLTGRSEREIMLATTELRRKNQCQNRQFAITARKLADFLVSLESEEKLLEQHLKNRENREVVTTMEVDKDSKVDASPITEVLSTEKKVGGDKEKGIDSFKIYEDY
ncbi:MAG: DDE-type integrase/transposase/recombinase [Candidatus Brocadiae bacterium]|nr:DDE-type integrase/transposase/recombinase [Candidatus Brocadiia bacterium]